MMPLTMRTPAAVTAAGPTADAAILTKGTTTMARITDDRLKKDFQADLLEYWRILVKRRWAILSVVTVLMVLSLIYSFTATTRLQGDLEHHDRGADVERPDPSGHPEPVRVVQRPDDHVFSTRSSRSSAAGPWRSAWRRR